MRRRSDWYVFKIDLEATPFTTFAIFQPRLYATKSVSAVVSTARIVEAYRPAY